MILQRFVAIKYTAVASDTYLRSSLLFCHAGRV
jgi:hypothetical protein